MAYLSSEATTAIAMHAVKIGVYQQRLALDRSLWLLGAGLGVAMILGTWTARRAVERLPRVWFERLVAALLVVVGLQMLVFG